MLEQVDRSPAEIALAVDLHLNLTRDLYAWLSQ
jgi:hypothetical protein